MTPSLSLVLSRHGCKHDMADIPQVKRHQDTQCCLITLHLQHFMTWQNYIQHKGRQQNQLQREARTKQHRQMGKNHMIALKCQRDGNEPSSGQLAFSQNSQSGDLVHVLAMVSDPETPSQTAA